MYKAVVIDLDGTLLNDDKKVGAEDLQSLYDLGLKNITRIIATGRSLFSFNEVATNNFPIDYLIFDSGGGIMDFQNKKIIHSKCFPLEEVKFIVEKLKVLKVDFQVRNKIPHSHTYYYKRFLNSNPDFDFLNRHYAAYAKPLENTDDLGEASRIIIISPEEDIVGLIENEFSEYSIIRASSPIDNVSVWMEIYPKNTNKGKALDYLTSLLDIPLSETVGLGNDYNDIHFLDITGQSYVVENAPEIIQKKYFTTTNNNSNPLTAIVRKNNIL